MLLSLLAPPSSEGKGGGATTIAVLPLPPLVRTSEITFESAPQALQNRDCASIVLDACRSPLNAKAGFAASALVEGALILSLSVMAEEEEDEEEEAESEKVGEEDEDDAAGAGEKS